ncbi:hypothetical protein SAMN03097708_01311 [Thiohalomonas denitrificans]|uniref:Uncharacterized protein n=1 Tax=Thiohalomonas denitrificans TaxID=415747 RepID=A0A1G5Q3H1_9GAMM|nr:hypothetical protein SAMN03097708_01311 [Thiohalomonas denitrificans]
MIKKKQESRRLFFGLGTGYWATDAGFQGPTCCRVRKNFTPDSRASIG